MASLSRERVRVLEMPTQKKNRLISCFYSDPLVGGCSSHHSAHLAMKSSLLFVKLQTHRNIPSEYFGGSMIR